MQTIIEIILKYIDPKGELLAGDLEFLTDREIGTIVKEIIALNH